MTASGLRRALAGVAATGERLSGLSRRNYQNPYTAVEWPEAVDPERDWFTSPELTSLYGTAVWEGMDERARRRLAFYEAVNFYSLNIHGEKALMQGLAARLYRADLLGVAGYLHHFLDEENKHSVYFGGFCTRYATVYRSRQVPLGGDRPRDVADFLFFAETMIFEEVVDHLNKLQARDGRLHPLARFINRNHHVEEARHLVFGRELVTALWEAADWPAEVREDLGEHLAQYLAACWRQYYNPDVYRDARLPGEWDLAEEAWAAPAQREHRRAASRRCVRLLTTIGILTKEPHLD